MSDLQKPRRKRGVPLKDLDRSKVYRIAHTGRRWEVLDADVVSTSLDAPDGLVDGDGGAASSTSAPAVQFP